MLCIISIKMKSTMFVISLCMVFSCYYFVKCEFISHEMCKSNKNCNILNVSLDPCPDATKNQPCKLYRGSNVTWTFDYTPQFSARKLVLQGYGHFLFFDVPYPDQDRDGCKFTQCPAVSGQKENLKYVSPIMKYYPPASYVAKWKLWNEANDDDECCFMVNIIIV